MTKFTFDFQILFSVSYLIDILITILFGVILVPLLLISYSVVKWSRKCWVQFVKWKHPNCVAVEKNSVRSILDQGRNQGIYTLLVQISDIDDELGLHLMRLSSSKRFLRMALTTKWGLYTWEYLDDFSLNNHLLISPNSYKGRAVTENNIQDYVSDITSKYLPSNHSPWQVHVINSIMNGEEVKFYLVRVHHLILCHEHLTLGDFLPLKHSIKTWSYQESCNPFAKPPYVEPTALPQLHQKLTESFSNTWNEFLCNNDPVERPEIMKKPIGLYQSLKIFVIINVLTVKEIMKQYRKNEGLRLTLFPQVFKRETARRNFGYQIILRAMLKCLNPMETLTYIIAWIWYLAVTFSLKTPILILRELRALKSSQKHYYPDTLTSVLSYYLPLIYHTAIEVITITITAIRATRSICEELFLKHAHANRLLNISSCGRKIVAWSEIVDNDILTQISNMTDADESEILLAAAVDSLKEYFRCLELPIPQDVLTTVKYTSQKALYVHANLDTKPSVYNSTYPLSSPHTSPLGITFKIAIISDLDTLSKSSSNDNVWNSFMKRGLLRWIPKRNLVTISWDHNHTILSSSMAFKGRGMELSELVVFDGKLLSFDDRTGMVYRLDANNAYPWIILTDGNGNNAKGFKSEWATVKDQQLYVGSMGKEWTTPNGEYVNNNPMWVKKISPTGQVTSIDWTENYKLLRQAYNIHFPGYMIHESAMWSAVHESWFFLPRRCSQSAFNEQLDEAMSCNIMLTADEHFKNIKVTEIGRLVKIRGFSSFKFLPGTNDSIIVALKTEEFRGQMATYIMAFNIDGTILMPELKVTDQKYEGLEFV